MKKKLLPLALALCLAMPSVAYADEIIEPESEQEPQVAQEEQQTYDAHFFIRYDSTVQDEDGSTHYSPSNYFPVGEVADGYEYGSSRSDYTSADGKVYSNTAYVEGAESIITQGNINLYHEFEADSETIEKAFDKVYSDIAVAPSDEVISTSILNAMGAEWQTAYNEGKIKVLWYVVKLESSYWINVDGCLYWVKSGESADKGDVDDKGNPVDPVPTPDPEPTPEPEPEPIVPDIEPMPIIPDSENAATNSNKIDKVDDTVDIPKVDSASQIGEFPKTSDDIDGITIQLLITIVVLSSVNLGLHFARRKY